MKKRSVWLVAGLGLVSACASAPTVEQFATACDRYGFARGTPEHATCVQMSAMQFNAEAGAARRQAAARLSAYGQSLLQ
jgi:hypothetical protein